MQTSEQIVFVDERGKPTGEIGPKLESHTLHTRLHRAFSFYIFRASDGAFLMTQRAKTKKVWPTVWTNSVCGHPTPGESYEAAIRRRTAYEVGIHNLANIVCLLPDYRYKTPPYNNIIENEFCPIYAAYTADEPMLNPDEVDAYKWITWTHYVRLLEDKSANMSYWARDQFEHLGRPEQAPIRLVLDKSLER